jgi:PIN domain nuclease of toxin-antitoxin system
MRLLLDAHALLWWLADDDTLAPDARALIADPESDVLVSAATVWEIALKQALGKLEAPDDLVGVLRLIGFVEVPVIGVDGVVAAGLDGHHRDPFDRILVAQALRLDASIVTRDAVFARYPASTITA